MKKKLLNYDFTYIQDINPKQDKCGKILEYCPQEKYKNVDLIELNRNGSGTFCKFSIQSRWSGVSGVYVFFIDDILVYIGQAVDFAQRFNMGYGNISPKNCFVGGQSTNCKINKLVLDSTKSGKKVEVYFYITRDYNKVESELIMHYKPQYNSTLNSNLGREKIKIEKYGITCPKSSKAIGGLAKSKNPSIVEVRKFIQSEIESAKMQGENEIEIRSGVVHKMLNMTNAMPTVCSAMRTLDGKYEYEVVEEPQKGNGSRLIYKYIL